MKTSEVNQQIASQIHRDILNPEIAAKIARKKTVQKIVNDFFREISKESNRTHDGNPFTIYRKRLREIGFDEIADIARILEVKFNREEK